MRVFLLFVFLLLHLTAQSQKVAVVMSGGAAKGIAHIGVLKALEEHGIPIDYIAGTSMGGIIAGCYAAGMSPQEIEDIILSDEFLRWVNGLPERGYNYHYHDGEVDPYFIRLNLSLDSARSLQFNTSIANDVSLNFALAEKMAQASAISKGNFDSLFVPLRVVAADVFAQKSVALSSGVLSDALRATQTVPFFYNPIRVDGKYLFDGGLYNNFPIDVAQKDFQPDVIIGSNVGTKVYEEYPYENDDKLINSSMLFLLIDKADPKEIPESGVYIQPDIRDYTGFDFDEGRALIDSGYSQTIRQIAEIKAKVNRHCSPESLQIKREAFKAKAKPFVFGGLKLNVFNSKQQRFIRRVFKMAEDKTYDLPLGEIKRSYFKMASESYFSNAYPNILYNEKTNKFDFQLTRRPQKNFQVDFGGVIATRDVSNIFLGLNYYYFNNALTHAYLGFQTGSFYKSVSLKTRIDLPFYRPLYIQPEASFNSWDYLEGEDVLQQTSSTVLKRFDRRVAVHIGWPMGNHLKSVISFSGINNFDRYINTGDFISTDQFDELRLRGFKTGIQFSVNDLNRKQYASAGKSIGFGIHYFEITEIHNPGNTSVETGELRSSHTWFRARASVEQYFIRKGWYHVGYQLEAVLSNQPFFRNYMATIANAPAYFPMQDSRTLLLRNFRSFNYTAGGIRNVFVLKQNRLDARIEVYGFKPIEQLIQGADQKATTAQDLKKVFFAGTAGLVFHSPIGPVSLSANYYEAERNELAVLLHVGFLLFNNHALER